MKYRGQIIGDLMGRPIFEELEQHDVVYKFDRVAQGSADEFGVSDLKKGEIFLNPGLIYKQAV